MRSKKRRKQIKKCSEEDKEQDEQLDLHGFTIEQGLLEVERFLEAAKTFRHERVRIIHGRGTTERSLRTAVRRYLTKASKLVDHIESEHHNDGSVIVYLKRSKDSLERIFKAAEKRHKQGKSIKHEDLWSEIMGCANLKDGKCKLATKNRCWEGLICNKDRTCKPSNECDRYEKNR